MLQGYQFDKMQVYPTSDASLYSFIGGERNVIIPNRGNEMSVTTNELSLTVDTGEALIQGRLVKITEPMSITVGANVSGYLVIEIDLSKANTSTGTPGQPDYEPVNNQLSLKIVTQLTQDNINDDGLLYHFNLGAVTSTTSTASFIKNKKTNPMYQPVLFEGAIKTGIITLSDNMYNYKFLVFLIKTESSVNGFGYGLFPVIQPENHGQSEPLIMADPTGEHYHSTYVGKFSYGGGGTTLTFEDPITNVTHDYGKNHGGATTYSVSKIIGIR